MADIQAFSALRYDLAKIGLLSDVVAPPYDVINQAHQDQLYDRSENNIVRVILNRPQDDDPTPDAIYSRAASILKKWRQEEILVPDNKPAVYAYQQKFSFDGNDYLRRGFMARIKLEPFENGRIFPHEQTHSKAKEDRLKLMKACGANTSPIFGIYPDESNAIYDAVESAIEDSTPVSATDELGVEHQLTCATNAEQIAKAAELMGSVPLFIADGHHRYETALNYRNYLVETQGIDENHPANYCLMMCVSMSDPGMVVLPTHRIFREFPPISSSELADRLASCFDCEMVGPGVEKAEQLWPEIELENRQSTMAFYAAKDNNWVMARLNEAGVNRMNEIASDQCETWRRLGVSILQKLVLDDLLAAGDLPTPKYVHEASEFIESFHEGDTAGRDATGQAGTGGAFQLGALVMPATLEHVREISLQKQRMPAKSTYFYPKLLSGLLINAHDL